MVNAKNIAEFATTHLLPYDTSKQNLNQTETLNENKTQIENLNNTQD